jgi:hypothetical protein
MTPIAAAGSSVPAVANSIMSRESGRVREPAKSTVVLISLSELIKVRAKMLTSIGAIKGNITLR